jgi:hypothetical protein
MKRRSFVQTLIGIIAAPQLPPIGASVAKIPPSAVSPPPTPSHVLPHFSRAVAPAGSAPWSPEAALHGLEAWQRLPMQPIPSLALLPPNSAPGEIQVAVLILKALEAAAPLDFTYYGGSQPSERRRVRPVLLFQKIHPEPELEMASPSPLYLLAWCLTRQATRTFRLDRMALESAVQFSV